MGSCSAYYSQLLLVAVLLAFLCNNASCIRPSVKISKADLKKLCSKTTNSTFCWEVLGSDPETPTAVLSIVGYIAVKKANGTIMGRLAAINNSISHIRDPTLHNRYTACYKDYLLVADAFRIAITELLYLGDYRTMVDKMLDATKAVKHCQDEFKEPPADVTGLEQTNKDATNFCSIVYNVGLLLLGQH